MPNRYFPIYEIPLTRAPQAGDGGGAGGSDGGDGAAGAVVLMYFQT